MKKLFVIMLALALQGCGVVRWMVAHPAESAAVATGAVVVQSTTGALANVQTIVEHEKK